jgi:hypothetical protein
VLIADGPFAETLEQIAGLLLVECQSPDEAIEVASQIPTAQFGTIEVRLVFGDLATAQAAVAEAYRCSWGQSSPI